MVGEAIVAYPNSALRASVHVCVFLCVGTFILRQEALGIHLVRPNASIDLVQAPNVVQRTIVHGVIDGLELRGPNLFDLDRGIGRQSGRDEEDKKSREIEKPRRIEKHHFAHVEHD